MICVTGSKRYLTVCWPFRFHGVTDAKADHGKVQLYWDLLISVGEGVPIALLLDKEFIFPALLLAHNILAPHAGKLAHHPVSCFCISFSQQSGMHFLERLLLYVLLRFRQLEFSFKPWVSCEEEFPAQKSSAEKRKWWLQRRGEGGKVLLRAGHVRCTDRLGWWWLGAETEVQPLKAMLSTERKDWKNDPQVHSQFFMSQEPLMWKTWIPLAHLPAWPA